MGSGHGRSKSSHPASTSSTSDNKIGSVGALCGAAGSLSTLGPPHWRPCIASSDGSSAILSTEPTFRRFRLPLLPLGLAVLSPCEEAADSRLARSHPWSAPMPPPARRLSLLACDQPVSCDDDDDAFDACRRSGITPVVPKNQTRTWLCRTSQRWKQLRLPRRAERARRPSSSPDEVRPDCWLVYATPLLKDAHRQT